MGDTSIEWTDKTWNPLRGCSRISPGCQGCYAEAIAERFSGPGQPFEGFAIRGKGWTRKVALVDEKLTEPLSWLRSHRVFVNSMSDFGHEDLEDAARDQILAAMLLAHRHTFQVLTKRAKNLRRYLSDEKLYDRVLKAAGRFRDWKPALMQVGISNPVTHPAPWIWWGVSIEDEETADDRLFQLVRTPAAVRFVSIEPLLEEVDVRHWLETYRCSRCGAVAHNESFGESECCETWSAPAIHWLIIGGESGPDARPFRLEWARKLLRAARMTGTRAFVKQLGARAEDAENGLAGAKVIVDPTIVQLTKRLKHTKGGDWDEWPAELRVREFPEMRP